MDLSRFYPDYLRIYRITELEEQIVLDLKSLKRVHKCPVCGMEMMGLHATHTRTVQDLPIFCKRVLLRITGYDYCCDNENCAKKVFAEDYGLFISRYERMTNRLGEFILALAKETSCEGAAHICQAMGIKISGDTIIRMLRKLSSLPLPRCSETIGVDDFAYRKGHSYCTVICDGESRRIIDIIDGRDGEGLKKWLQSNRHVNRITRDRAGAYARAISDVLPEAMQIADRFHLHQNLLSAIKDALKRELPNQIEILAEPDLASDEDAPSLKSVKKNE